jgi:chromosome segregation ATPase
MHFDQICVHLNKFKDVVKKSNCKLGILTTSGVGFINNENEIELFTLSGQNPERFSRLKIYLTYDLEDFTSNIDSVPYEVNELYPKFIDELSKEFEITETSLKSNRTLNNLDGIKRLLQKLKEKQEHLHQDSQELTEIFKEIKKRKKEMKAKHDNVQQRFKIEKLEKTEEGATFFKMEVEDEHSNLLAHCLNIMHIINKQCNNINEYLEFIKEYCKL